MISITEIVLVVAGIAAIILGYLLPAGKEMDEEDKKLMEKEIRELVRREVEGQKDAIADMIDDTVENSLDRTERAMERISNEKLSAIGEYSDTVISDIHKNHDEVMFMYDMLNDKHKNLTSVMGEVTKKADEARQVVRDAEITAREAQEANVRAILLDEADDRLKGITIPYKKERPENKPMVRQEMRQNVRADSGQEVYSENRQDAANRPVIANRPDAVNRPVIANRPDTVNRPVIANRPEPANRPVIASRPEPAAIPSAAYQEPSAEPVGAIESGYVDEKNLREFDLLEEIPAEILSSDQISGLHVIGGTAVKDNTSDKVVSITESVRVEGRTRNPDSNMTELIANDPVSQNRQIIEMHKAGKSNMVIARELGLGIGEVKLVIDLSNKHRKVR
ncbi:MAG: hypothetical protein K6E91_03235 [Butyrivibrio sp.]|nr:hypothetical protein [Butyrivibrio sp.]